MGQLMLIAYKDRRKVYDKRIDFNSLHLFTKCLYSKKRYSDLSEKVFNEIIKISYQN